MTIRTKRIPKTLFRVLTEEERRADWYVDLPDDRPTFGKRVSMEEWLALVMSRIVTLPDGTRVLDVPALWGDAIVVGTEEWKDWLLGTAMYLRRRLFWEPRESVGLTEEGARRYGGSLVADSVRRAREAEAAAQRRERRARTSQLLHKRAGRSARQLVKC